MSGDADRPGAATAAPAAHAPNRVVMTWAGGKRFDVGRPGGPVVRIDGGSGTGPTPVDTLLGALAACSAVDVVSILAKRRTPLASLSVEVIGERVTTQPRRLRHVLLRYRMAGAGIERDQALRAIELAVTRYCSVGDSLRPDIVVEWELELEGATAPAPR